MIKVIRLTEQLARMAALIKEAQANITDWHIDWTSTTSTMRLNDVLRDLKETSESMVSAHDVAQDRDEYKRVNGG